MEAEKVCTKCKEIFNLSTFYIRKDKASLCYSSWCKPCYARCQRYRYSQDQEYKTSAKRYSTTIYYRLKAEVIEAYGGECKCCGEKEPRFLTVDHIFGDGAVSRRNGEGLGGNLYSKLKKFGFPKDRYQLLCFNCNCSKRQFGECPHVTSRRELSPTEKES